ncbi:MAG: hypothetical protein ACQERJ_02040 [Bacillota bacterium]
MKKQDLIDKLKKETKFGAEFGTNIFLFFLILIVVINMSKDFQIPIFQHEINFFNGEHITQVVVVLGFYMILKSLKEIKKILIKLIDIVHEEENNKH